MAKERVRTVVEFTEDYAVFKKGDQLSISRSLGHQLTTVQKVAKVIETIKEDGKKVVAKAKTTKK